MEMEAFISNNITQCTRESWIGTYYEKLSSVQDSHCSTNRKPMCYLDNYYHLRDRQGSFWDREQNASYKKTPCYQDCHPLGRGKYLICRAIWRKQNVAGGFLCIFCNEKSVKGNINRCNGWGKYAAYITLIRRGALPARPVLKLLLRGYT